MTEVLVTTEANKTYKAPVKLSHHQQTNTHLFTGRMPNLSPNQQRQNTGISITFHGLVLPSTSAAIPFLSSPLKTPGYLVGGLPSLSSAL